MVEDIDTSSPLHKQVIKSIEDRDDALSFTGQKATNSSDQFPFQINGDSVLQGIEDRDIYTAVTKGVTKEERFEATEFNSPYNVANGKDSGEDKHSHVVTDVSAIDCRHPQFAVFDNECDPCTVKDIWVDEGEPKKNGKGPKSDGNLNHDKHQTRDSDERPLSELKSSKRIAQQASTNESFDFESLLDQVEADNSGAQGTANGIANTSFLNELMVSEGNPFLENLPFEVSQKDGREAVMNVPHINPFDIGVKFNETEVVSVEMEGISKTIMEERNSSIVIISAYNPFLENSSVKAIKENDKEATKVSENDTIVDGTYHREVAADGNRYKQLNDSKVEDAGDLSNVRSATDEASDGIKVPEHIDSPANPAQLQHERLESSFASINPSSALISYSGQIPFSGSISHRSESSATSNRSFAFPVLQTEWNTSPVKMAGAKAKHNSWIHTLLCCNF